MFPIRGGGGYGRKFWCDKEVLDQRIKKVGRDLCGIAAHSTPMEPQPAWGGRGAVGSAWCFFLRYDYITCHKITWCSALVLR